MKYDYPNSIKNNKNDKLKKCRGITDSNLTIIMMLVIVIALIFVTLCIFVVGKNLGNKPIETTDEPNDSTAYVESEYITNEKTVVGQSNDIPGLTDTPTESDIWGVTEIPTEPPTITETSNIPVITEPSYIPITPDDVTVIGKYEIDSEYAILIDCETNLSIAQRLADRQIYPASMTKVMTILIACETVDDLNAKVTMRFEVINNAYAQGASMSGFKVGEVVTIKDLLYAAALPSGADATTAIAEYIAGSETEFAVLMNKKAKELGMNNTNFVTASGLHAANHYSTVRDIATLMNYSMQNQLMKEILSSVSYETTVGLKIYSSVFNKTLYRHKTYSNDVTMIAGKSGYTPEAMYCLVTYYEKADGHGFILVTAYACSSRLAPIDDAELLIEKYINQ